MAFLSASVDSALVATIIEAVSIGGAIIAAFVLGIWKGFRKLHEQFKPNGGSSLRDAIDRIEKNLHVIDARQISLFDMSLAGVFITDEKGHCIYVSPSWCELTGLLPMQSMGDGWTAGVGEVDRERVFLEWHRATERAAIFESKYITNTGKRVVSRASAMYHPQTKKAIGFIGKVWEENDRRD